MNKYYSIVTDMGTAAITNAALLGIKVDITDFAVGDGGGSYYQPTANMTALKNKSWQGKVTAVEAVANQANMLRIKAIIPSNVGGFTIREMGVLNGSGQLIAIANTPDMQKVAIADGVSSELEAVIEIAVSNAEVVNFTVDPTVIIATKKDVTLAVSSHNTEPTAHATELGKKADKTQVAADITTAVAAHNTDTTAHSELRQQLITLQNTVTSQGGKIARLEDAIFNDITKNPFMVQFESLTGLAVSGVWNAQMKRIEC